VSVEDRVRGSLQRQASDVDPAADGWDRIVQRVREGEPVPQPAPSRARRMAIIAAALALFALALVPLLLHRSDTTSPAANRPAASGASSVPSESTPLTADPCRADQLFAHEIVTDGAAGNVWAPVVLVNRGTVPCRLGGYPTVRFLGAAGNDLGLRAAHSPKYTGAIPPSPVPRVPFVLAPGGKAWFVVYFSDVQPPCTRVFALSIVPAGAGGPVTMRVNPIHEWAVCSSQPTLTAMTPNRPRI